MTFRGFAHVTLVVSDFEGCCAFYDRVMRHLGMKRYLAMPQLFRGWFAGESMFVITHAAPGGDRFSQFRVGLHHLSFRASSREEVDLFGAMLKEIGARIIREPEVGPWWPGYYSVLCEDPDGTRIEMNYMPAEGWAAIAQASEAGGGE